MPIHTDKTAKIPKPQYSQFPKSLDDFSTKVDNKFLNDNLHTIEEMEYRKKGITDGFRNYQNKYYDKKEILNHDLYFTHEGKTYPRVSGSAGMNIKNVGFLGSLKLPAVNGQELESNAGASTYTGNSAGGIYACRTDASGDVTDLYDRLAMSDQNSLGNQRLASYSDSGSTTPDVIYAETGSNALDSAYTWRSVTEFGLTTALTWIAMQVDNSGGTAYPYYTAGAGITYAKSQVMGAFTTTGFGSSSPDYLMKMGHT